LLEGFSHEGQPGLHVLTPFLLPGNEIVMINRGWLPETRTRDTSPDLSVGEDVRELNGRVVPYPQAGLRLEAEAATQWPRRVVYPTHQDIADALGVQVHPHMIWLNANEADGFVRAWKPSEFGPARHVGYAVQWFGLAVTLILIYIILQFRRRRE
ncbi:MAG: SURF1 family protein, partial [Gammaproteobacteria bacterium]|nr:SURF1 family protein [Gammaproteobacteria bacterium]